MRLRAVIEVTGLSKTSIYDLINEGSFPRQFALSENRSGWRKSEIADWCRNRKPKSRKRRRIARRARND
ncbi:helix-turn-helix transcriptional regulator [Afipia clevelandensis]|uniref:helix-turn-helix transcriptional regulator n=1 Tax=Afipia clevelandensis TaxID=1034 RepID=UPI0009DABC7D|nr:AlpA family phage regulatory protein [Afipia clevelandensis]